MKTTLTLNELRAATVAQILTDIAANNTKREIVTELLGQDRITDRPVITRDDQGRIVKRVEVERDLLTGDVLESRETTHSYFKTGEIKDIVVSERDAKDKETGRRTIHHFTNGREPVMQAHVVEPEPKPVER